MVNFDEVYAVPGAGHIIDVINPVTGLTCVYAKDLAAVLADNPGAVRMTWEAWRTEAADRQHTPISWHLTDEDTYQRMLEVLPPTLWIGGAFLVGEPDDHDFTTGQPRFRAYRCRGGVYTVANRPLTCAELRTVIGSRA